jgi:hypothetical protein
MKKSINAAAILFAGIAMFSSAIAADDATKAQFKLARETAAENYKIARKACDSLAGNPKDVCVAQARADRIKTESEAMAANKNTLRAVTKSRKDIAAANYDVAKKQCNSRTGNERDVCIKQAKAVLTVAVADADADKKVVEARLDARNDKTTAIYKVEIEKCDALAGSAKNDCVASVKQRFAGMVR